MGIINREDNAQMDAHMLYLTNQIASYLSKLPPTETSLFFCGSHRDEYSSLLLHLLDFYNQAWVDMMTIPGNLCNANSCRRSTFMSVGIRCTHAQAYIK